MITLKKVDVKDDHAMHVHVYFNDEPQMWVIRANAEEGYVVRVVLDISGDFVYDASDEIVFEAVYGDVEIYYSR